MEIMWFKKLSNLLKEVIKKLSLFRFRNVYLKSPTRKSERNGKKLFMMLKMVLIQQSRIMLMITLALVAIIKTMKMHK